MFLLNYDFYDLHAFITFFRNDSARFPDYIEPVRKITEHLDSPNINQLEYNTIRRIIRPYHSSKDEALSWVAVNNVYTANILIIKEEPYYRVLSSLFKEMLDAYNDVVRLNLLCDAAHNIPLILSDEKKPKPSIVTMIRDYRNKYNKFFLTEELKEL